MKFYIESKETIIAKTTSKRRLKGEQSVYMVSRHLYSYTNHDDVVLADKLMEENPEINPQNMPKYANNKDVGKVQLNINIISH